MLIAQITDFHVTEPGWKLFDAIETGRGLARAVERINQLPRQPALHPSRSGPTQ